MTGDLWTPDNDSSPNSPSPTGSLAPPSSFCSMDCHRRRTRRIAATTTKSRTRPPSLTHGSARRRTSSSQAVHRSTWLPPRYDSRAKAFRARLERDTMTPMMPLRRSPDRNLGEWWPVSPHHARTPPKRLSSLHRRNRPKRLYQMPYNWGMSCQAALELRSQEHAIEHGAMIGRPPAVRCSAARVDASSNLPKSRRQIRRACLPSPSALPDSMSFLFHQDDGTMNTSDHIHTPTDAEPAIRRPLCRLHDPSAGSAPIQERTHRRLHVLGRRRVDTDLRLGTPRL